ncbi:RNA-directed DNA polymerase, eukaryota, reverse transcriptase zinc-binding domain protein [Tanacetum coccineum]
MLKREWILLLIIDNEFIKKKLQPLCTKTKDWIYDMINYFKYAWEAMERKEKDLSDDEDVFKNMNQAVNNIIADESNGSSGLNMEMSEFRDVINSLEIDDLYSSGFNFTWTKSLKNPLTNTLKKLDKMMINEEFIQNHGEAHGIFLPYLISYHNPSILDVWKKEIKGCNMYRVVQKLKILKKPLRKLNWKNGNLFEKVQELKQRFFEIQRELDGDPFNKNLKESLVQIGKEYTEATKDELKLLHQIARINWLKEGDKNSAFFHSILRTRKNKSKVETICKEDGSRVEGEKVPEQFVNHFQDILGKSKLVQPLSNMNEFIQAKLSEEDALEIIAMVSNEEIKAALFDIDSCKAAGPDGYTSLPKIDTPNKVSDFRPIACCNVLYKCISKILTNKIKEGLSKVVIINQSAFIPGRHIQDNILISQDLLKGYNRNNRAKSYVYNMIMIKNIAATPSFKYHYGCKELKLTHMCFADDLIVLCNGDKASLEVVKKSIEDFSCISGLFPNLSKSIIFFGSINEDRKKELLEVIPFKYGKLPMNYKNSNGKGVFMWYDNWCKLVPLANIIPKKSRNEARMKDNDFVADLVQNGVWLWPAEWLRLYPELNQVLYSYDNLFFSCHYSAKVWKEMRSKGNISSDCKSLESTVGRLATKRLKNNIWKIMNKLILSAPVYFVWNERNRRIFKDEARSVEELVIVIKKHMTDMLMSLNVKSSGALVMVAKTWGLALGKGRLVPHAGLVSVILRGVWKKDLCFDGSERCCYSDYSTDYCGWWLNDLCVVLDGGNVGMRIWFWCIKNRDFGDNSLCCLRYSDYVLSDYGDPSNGDGNERMYHRFRIEKHVNYFKLSSLNICFATSLNKSTKPKSYVKATQYKNWTEAMNSEMKALHRNTTLVLSDLPVNRKTIGCK